MPISTTFPLTIITLTAMRSNSGVRDTSESPEPFGRLCQIVNVASGTLLDVTVSKDSNLPVVIGSPEGLEAIHRWRIYPLGPGWVLEAVSLQPDGGPRYLAPWGDIREGNTLTTFKFPLIWELRRISEPSYESDQFDRPEDMEEEWICFIRWPFGLGGNNRVLDLHCGSKDLGTKVHFHSYREPKREPCQHWRIQFVPSPSNETISSTTGSSISHEVEAHTKVITIVETTIVTHTKVLPPNGQGTTKSHTSRTSTTSAAYFKPDGSIENDILCV